MQKQVAGISRPLFLCGYLGFCPIDGSFRGFAPVNRARQSRRSLSVRWKLHFGEFRQFIVGCDLVDPFSKDFAVSANQKNLGTPIFSFMEIHEFVSNCVFNLKLRRVLVRAVCVPNLPGSLPGQKQGVSRLVRPNFFTFDSVNRDYA